MRNNHLALARLFGYGMNRLIRSIGVIYEKCNVGFRLGLDGFVRLWGGMLTVLRFRIPKLTNRKEQAQALPRKAVPTNRVSYAVNRQADQLSEQGEVEQGFVPYEDVSKRLRARTFSRGFNRVIRGPYASFRRTFAKRDEESIQAAIEAYKKLPEGPGRFSELRMLASAGLNPTLPPPFWTRELGGFEQRIGSGAVMDSWSRSDPQGAIAWVKKF